MGQVVFICVPYGAQESLLTEMSDSLAGKVVVNVVAPLTFREGRAVALAVPEGSAAEESAMLLPRSQVVAAFQNLSARKLLAAGSPMEGDVVVCSDCGEAKERVMALVELIENLRGVDGGALENARYVEQLTALSFERQSDIQGAQQHQAGGALEGRGYGECRRRDSSLCSE